MRFKRLLPILLSVTTSVFTLSGCSDFDNDWTANEIMYKESFAKTFGKIDPEQDWNLASRAGVTVTTSSPKDIKVYAFTDGKYKLVADYANVSGTKTLGFDVREDVCELMVTDGSQSYRVKPGESVSFGMATRAIYGTEGDDAIVSVEDYVEFDADKYVGTVVEKETGILPEEEANLDKVVQNFSYISNGPFTIHPIYWNSSSSHILGVYWKENGVYHYQDVYKNKDAEGKEVATREFTKPCAHQFKEPEVGMNCKYGHGTLGSWTHTDNVWKFYNNEGYEMTSCNYNCFDIPYNVGDVCPTCGKIIHIDQYGQRFTDIEYTGIANAEANKNGMIYSKGITINLPIGTLFGFYMKVITNGTEYTHTLYSQGELNASQKGDFFNKTEYPTKSGCSVTTDGKNHEGTTAWAATFQTEVDGQTVQYLCFEDWSNNLTDLNDLVFATPVTDNNTPPSIVDEDAQTWIICAEDLGNSYDIDYNDVVLEVKHVSGKNKATISPIAAGGTLASYVYLDDKCLGEVHECLGQPNNISGKYLPVNVAGEINTSIIKDIEVDVPTNWSLASSTIGDASYDEDAALTMGGISIRVVPEGTQASQSEANNAGLKIQNSIEKGDDNVPYMICVPRNYTRYDEERNVTINAWFRWSKEMKSLYPLEKFGDGTYNALGHKFADWVANKDAAKDWYMFPDLENTMGLVYNETAASNGESGPTTPAGSTSLMSYVGANTCIIPLSVFTGITSATVTVISSVPPQSSFDFYGFTNSDPNATFGDNTPGNVSCGNGTTTFELSSSHIDQINSTGSWKITFNGQHSTVTNFYITPNN